jgi:CO/xanthine dehydrogenase FAD-binding subunit
VKPAPFEYLVPDSLEAALAMLAQYGEDAKLLAGGQSLVPAMNFRLVQPGVLIDLNRLNDLAYVHPSDAGGLRVGAMTRQSRLESDALVSTHAPLVAETAPYIAHPQIRNRGTFGGSLAHADPAAELPVITLALDADFRVQSSDRQRMIPATDFFQGMFTTDLEPDEMLVEVEIPPQGPKTGWSFMEIARRQGDYAMMGIAALVSLDEDGVCQRARLVYLNAGDGPVSAVGAARLLEGERFSPRAIESAAILASEEEIDPPGSVHATPEFQRHLAKVLTRRALQQAYRRANGGSDQGEDDDN